MPDDKKGAEAHQDKQARSGKKNQSQNESNGNPITLRSSLATKTSLRGQSTLDNSIKRVKFANDGSKSLSKGELDDATKTLLEEINKIRQEKVEIEKIKIELLKKNVELHERMGAYEKRMDDFESRMKEYELRMNEMNVKQKEIEISILGSEAGTEGEGSQEVLDSFRSRDSSVQSRSSIYSNFSQIEMKQMKILLNDKDKSERKDNIIIKGVQMKNENIINEVTEFLKNKLEVDVSVASAWQRGKLVVAKIKTFEQKMEIMKNKNKLVGTKIFIENDLTFDERKRQEEIINWVKIQKNKGTNIKIGYGKVRIGTKWIKWEDLVKKMQDINQNSNLEEWLGRIADEVN